MAKRTKKERPLRRAAHYKLAKTLVRARAERALQDNEELERQAAALVEQLRDAYIGARQRDSGRKGKGKRREKYAGKPIPSPQDVRAAVLAMHTRFPRLTFNAVCDKVGRQFDYKSGWAPKDKAHDIKWSDPRRKRR